MPEILKPVPQPIEAPSGDTLTADYASELLFHAFRHGQGDPRLQKQFYLQLHRLHPEWKMSDSFLEEMKQESWRKISRYVSAPQDKFVHLQAQADELVIEFTDRANNMQEVFNQENPIGPLQISRLATYLILRDAEYVENGRHRYKHDSSNPALDTKLSFLVHYGFLGNSTGNKDFDQIYKDVKNFFSSPLSHYLDSDLWGPLDFLIRTHNEAHPDQKVELPQIEN